MNNKIKVAVIGLGYVGLPLAVIINKNKKYSVAGYDLSKEKISMIRKGLSPIKDDLVDKELKNNKLNISDSENILKNSDIFIICVPTPIDSASEPNYKPLEYAAKTIVKYLKKGNTVIVESTVNPGACEEVVLPILESKKLKGKTDFILAHCPERINPGDKKWNVTNIPRNVGTQNKKDCKKVANFYRDIIEAKVNEMDTLKEAEATKIIENTFRDINIAYVNELAMSFDKLGINLVNVLKGAANKPFAFMAHFPGCGVGGHCIAVDPYYLIKRAKQVGFDHHFLKVAREVNNYMPRYTVERLIKGLNCIGKSIKNSRIAILGLSYKNNIGDLRESPALKIIEILEKEYLAKLNIFDPYFPAKSTHKKLDQILKESEAIILSAGHKEFLKADYNKYEKIKLIIDGRNCLDKDRINNKILYFGIGR